MLVGVSLWRHGQLSKRGGGGGSCILIVGMLDHHGRRLVRLPSLALPLLRDKAVPQLHDELLREGSEAM